MRGFTAPEITEGVMTRTAGNGVVTTFNAADVVGAIADSPYTISTYGDGTSNAGRWVIYPDGNNFRLDNRLDSDNSLVSGSTTAFTFQVRAFARVAETGSYDDLTGEPTIPVKARGLPISDQGSGPRTIDWGQYNTDDFINSIEVVISGATTDTEFSPALDISSLNGTWNVDAQTVRAAGATGIRFAVVAGTAAGMFMVLNNGAMTIDYRDGGNLRTASGLSIDSVTAHVKRIELPSESSGPQGEQGPQGRYRVRVYRTTTHNASAPAKPVATSYNPTTDSLSGLTSGWGLSFPSFDPATQDVYESFAAYDPSASSLSEFSVPFEVGAEIGPAGSAGPTGAKGDKGDKGDTGDTGPQGPQGPAGMDGTSGSSTDTNSYFIDAWLRTPKGSTVSSSALTSAGIWNNNQGAPGFTTKPTDNVAAGIVYDVSDLPASASTDGTYDYHRFRRIFTIGETNVPASSWKYLGQANHPIPTPGQILIQAFVRIQAGDVPTNTALTSGGVWDQQAQRFTTKPTNNVLGGFVYDRSDLPDDAVTSTEYDYWQYNRYYTEGEGTVAGSAWWRVGKLDQDAASGGGGTSTYTETDIAISSTSPNTTTRQEVVNGTSYDKIYVTVKLGNGAWVQGTSNANLRYGGEIIVSHLGSGSANSTNFVGIGRGANNYALNAYISGTTVIIRTLDINATTQLANTSILKITGVNF